MCLVIKREQLVRHSLCQEVTYRLTVARKQILKLLLFKTEYNSQVGVKGNR